MGSKRKIKSVSQLKKELDRVYSIWIRSKDSVNGLNKCYTCGQLLEWKHLDCGHYWSRRYMGTRWFAPNTKPQCKGCNRFHEGNKPKFTLALIHEYGSDILEKLELKAKSPAKYSTFELESLIEEYKNKLKGLR